MESRQSPEDVRHTTTDKGVSIVCLAGESWAVIESKSTPSFADFARKLKALIPWTRQAPDNYTFEITPGQKCSLQSEAEYHNMLLLCEVTHKDFVYAGLAPCETSRIHASKDHLKESPSTIDGYFKHTKINVCERPPSDSFHYGGRTFADVDDNTPPHKKKAGMPEGSRRAQHTTTEEDVQGQQATTIGTNPYAKYSERRKRKAKQHQAGEFYHGATTTVPDFMASAAGENELETPALRSAKWTQYITGPGQEFLGGAVEFRAKLVKYSAKLGFQFNYSRNDRFYVKASCKELEQMGCQWFVNASLCRLTGSFFIRAGNLSHTCPMSHMINDPSRLGQRILGDIITETVRNNPGVAPIDMKRDIDKNWGFSICYEKIWRGVEVARSNMFGNYHDSFNELRWYSAAITKTNPGSIVRLDIDPIDNRFQRLFLAFNGSLKGFQHCRPMLFVDGTFMKSRYKGTLLAATAKDGNNGLFPVAIAIVASENAENWEWFLTKIKEHVKHEREIMFISDRAGGLLNAFNDVYQKPLHFFCLFHLMKNLRVLYGAKKYSDKFKNKMCKLLKDVAYAPTHHTFDRAISDFIKNGGDKAVHFLKDLPYEKWAIAFSPDIHRYGELTSNAAESFNNWITDARSLPVTFMVDCIRLQLMRWFNERREEAHRWTGALTPAMEERWNELLALGENWTIVPTNKHGVFEVLAWTSCVVDLHLLTCTCYQWQIRGFPCAHAVASINKSRWDIRQVVEPSFFTNTYQLVYQQDINPIPTTERFEFLELNSGAKILPPVFRKAPGRPRVFRRRAKGEPKRQQFLCGRCGKKGTHLWTTCLEALS